MNSLHYLRKTRIDEELDNLILTELRLTFGQDGRLCKKCGIIQGQVFKGFEKYYCEHLTRRIDKKLKKRSEEIAYKIIDLTYQDVEITS